jgi:hypothetical protein
MAAKMASGADSDVVACALAKELTTRAMAMAMMYDLQIMDFSDMVATPPL